MLLGVFLVEVLKGNSYPFRKISRTRVFRLRCVTDNKSRDGTELQIIKSVNRNGALEVLALALPNKAKYVMQIHMRMFVGRNTQATAANSRLPRSLSEEGKGIMSALAV